MNSASAECRRTVFDCLQDWIKLSSPEVLLSCALLVLTSVGQAQAAAPINSSGLNTQVSQPVTLPTGQTQYNITGGTRPGGGTNLFHSFGDFNVPTNNIANFLNETALPTSNILGRVTGGNPSVIFGMIQTNGPGGFGNANLFLMNPSGFLFGPNATLNVGGMVAFSTADYLRFQGTDNLFNSASTPQSLSQLSIAPVAAFGFLGNNPAAIAIQGSTLKVADGQSLSLVGGNQGFIATDPDTGNPIPVTGGITMTGGKLSAPGGQINVATVAGPGEVSAVDFMPTPGMAMGNITLSQGALLDVSADAAGTVRIRGGQFVIDNATISADTGNSPGALTAIDIDVTDAVSLTTTSLSALTARTFGAGNAGDIVISSGSLNATFGTDAFDVALIDSHTMGSGHGGNVTITTGQLSATGTLPQSGDFIGSGTGADGNGGNVTIIAGDAQFTSMFIDTGLNTFFGSGSGGNLTVKAQSLIIDNVLWGTDSMGRAGAIDLESAGLLRITGNSFISNQGLLGDNPITIKADRFVLDFTRILAGTLEDGGDVSVTSRIVEFSNGGSIGTQTFGDGHAGNIFITASERVSFMDDPNSLTPSGLYTTSLGGAGNLGNAGNITVDTPRLELINGARINASTFTSGQGGNVTITNADTILITGERSPGPPFEQLLQGGTRASGIYTSTLGSDFCTGACGNAGHIDITTGSLTLQNGGMIDSGSVNSGHGGNVTIGASGQVLLSGTMADGTPGGIFSRTIGTTPDAGPGGNIALTAGQSVTISDGASVSASSKGPGSTGNILINAGNQFTMTNHSSVTTEADHASGGIIKITTDPSGTVQLTDSTISASVLDGTGGGGSVNIDPQLVLLMNSQITAKAVQGPGGNISITTNFLFQDANSEISASSQFGVNGTVTIQSPNAPISGQIQPLGKTPLIATSLLNQSCASLAGGEFSSFTVAGRDSLPTEPSGWLTSPLALATLSAGAGEGQGVRGEERAGDTQILSLRQIAPAGFLTQAFAVDRSASCHS